MFFFVTDSIQVLPAQRKVACTTPGENIDVCCRVRFYYQGQWECIRGTEVHLKFQLFFPNQAIQGDR